MDEPLIAVIGAEGESSVSSEPTGVLHEVLRKHAYLDLLLFVHGYRWTTHTHIAELRSCLKPEFRRTQKSRQISQQVRGPTLEDHVRYSLVCKDWARFESDSWDSYFPQKASLRWRAAAVSIIPVLAETRISHALASRRSIGPFYEDQVFGMDWKRHLKMMHILFLASTGVGIVLAANVADGGMMRETDPLLLAIPFVVGPVCLFSVLCHHCLRLVWKKRSDWRHQQKEQNVIHLIERTVPELALNANDARQLAVVMSNDQNLCQMRDKIRSDFVKEAQGNRRRGLVWSTEFVPTTSDFVVTIHPDGTKSRGVMAGVNERFASDTIHTSKAEFGIDPYIDGDRNCLPDGYARPFVSAPICSGWPSDGLYAGMASGIPMTLASACPLLLSLGHSYVVSFVPAVLAAFVALVGIVCTIHRHTQTFTQNGDCGDYVGTAVSTCPIICAMGFFVVYALARDGHISANTTGEWAIILTPVWALALFLTIMVLACFVEIARTMARRRLYPLIPVSLLLMLSVASVAAAGVFDFCLVGLCYKASGEWDFMSYTGFSSIMCGCVVTAIAGCAGGAHAINKAG